MQLTRAMDQLLYMAHFMRSISDATLARAASSAPQLSSAALDDIRLLPSIDSSGSVVPRSQLSKLLNSQADPDTLAAVSMCRTRVDEWSRRRRVAFALLVEGISQGWDKPARPMERMLSALEEGKLAETAGEELCGMIL